MPRYEGDIVDAHHHLWDVSLGKHPWLTSADHSIKALGDIGDLRRDYLIKDYLFDVASQPVVASVCVEAGWDRSCSPVDEIAWYNSLKRPGNIAGRFVGWAPLRSPQIEQILEEITAFPALVGVRETIRWHPDPAKRWTEAGLLGHPDWLRGFSLLNRHGLLLEVLMNPYQSDDIARLAAAHPDQQIIVNHCGTPVDRDKEGMRRWRDGLAKMGVHENIAIKLSNFPAYASNGTSSAMGDIVSACLDAFGTRRALFASDFPVGKRNLPFSETCNALKDILADLSADEQRHIFHVNALALYRFSEENAEK